MSKSTTEVIVEPIAINVVNWAHVQRGFPSFNCKAKLKKMNVGERDPAALALMLSNGNLKDQYACKLCLVQFMVGLSDVPFKQIGPINQYEVYSDGDSEDKGFIYILSGTADVWRMQLLAECVKDNDPVRRKVFNRCYDYICRTGLKSMFTDIQRRSYGETFLLL